MDYKYYGLLEVGRIYSIKLNYSTITLNLKFKFFDIGLVFELDGKDVMIDYELIDYIQPLIPFNKIK